MLRQRWHGMSAPWPSPSTTAWPPEHPYPAAVEDCYAAFVRLTESATELGIEPGYVAVYGESADGGLAAAGTLLSRDRSGPHTAFQVLGIPELDERLQTESMPTYADTPVRHHRNAVASWTARLGSLKPGSPAVPPYAASVRAHNLSDLPPPS